MTGGSRRGLWLLGSAVLAIVGVIAFRSGVGAVLGGAMLAMAGVIAFFSAWRTPQSDPRGVPTSADVSTPSKLRVKPIVKLREEVLTMIDSHRSNPVISAMAFDTLTEVDSIVLRSMDILEAKRRLQRLAAAVFPSRAAVRALEEKHARTTDPAAKASVEGAIATRREELRILQDLEAQSSRLDANLDEAEAALAELRSRLLKVVASSSEQAAAEEMDPLSGMTERLHRISSTMEESVEMVSTRIGSE